MRSYFHVRESESIKKDNAEWKIVNRCWVLHK